MPARKRRRFTLQRFWAAVHPPFFSVGAEWGREAGRPGRRPSSRRAVEARVRREIEAEQRASETPIDQMLREVEEDAARRFRRALKESEPIDAAVYGVVRAVAGDERRKRKKGG